MTQRKPHSDDYDALVSLEPKDPGQSPAYAFALVKFTYDLTSTGLVAAKSEPLVFDIYGDPSLTPRLPPGSDFWVTKRATDVIVLGAATTLEKKPAPTLEVSVRVADRAKRIAVFGHRSITARSGRIVIGEPELFSEIPISYVYAYGGLDPRVPVPDAEREEYFRYAATGGVVDHPGLYPRNPIGKGYLVYPEPMEGMEMPNIEDPDDLLDADRLVVGQPELWYRQPMPWSLEWTNLLMYPRELLFGFDAWFPCPEPAQLAEVKRGFFDLVATAPEGRSSWPPEEAYQEASLGMTFPGELGGAPVQISGMSADRPIMSFTIPSAPTVELEVDGRRERCAARLTQLVIRTAENKVNAVWLAKTTDLPRVLVPGIHANIRLAASVDGGEPVRYVCPPPIRERLARARTASADPPTGSAEPQ